MKGLLDTSVFVAQETGRSLAALPDEAAISVITLAELHLGVLLARDRAIRASRLRTLSRVEGELQAIPIDAEVARVFASIVAEARQSRRRPSVMDVWIAATGVRHGLVVFTQDADFDNIPQVQVRRI
ncbi:MAG: type II toxin-antitoxin system VapC family toxin [Chloroflexi bacterium]|nr:MAG: type II toxin-antitoxin system VapC family toxin [Chloroflexota bacterium]